MVPAMANPDRTLNEADIATRLLQAWRGTPLAQALAPVLAQAPVLASEAQAYGVQRHVLAGLRADLGGWKVGAAGPDAPPNCAPMPAAGIVPAPHCFDPAVFTRREVESEICFRLGADLPPRRTPYTGADILGAIKTCHPGIEVLQSRYADPDAAGALANLADLIQHGAFAWGAPIQGWRTIDFSAVTVTQTIAGGPSRRATGNPAGDMVRLMVWLANEGAVWAGGLKAGQIVTCGSWTGKTAAPRGAEIVAAFQHAEPVQIVFGP